MIVSLVAALVTQQPLVWATCDDFSHFVESPFTSEVLYQQSSGHVVTLSAAGSEVGRVKLEGRRALYKAESGGIVSMPSSLLTKQPDVGTIGATAEQWTAAFANWEHVFLCGPSSIFVDGPVAFVPTGGNYLGGCGVSRDGQTVVSMTVPIVHLLFAVARRIDSKWRTEPSGVTHVIEGLGACFVVPRFNDMRFIDAKTVVFIGGIERSSKWSEAKQKAFDAKLIDLTSTPLEDPRDKKATCYLLAADIVSKKTWGVAKFAHYGVSGRGVPRFGQVTISDRQGFLYVHAMGKILRIPTYRIQSLG